MKVRMKCSNRDCKSQNEEYFCGGADENGVFTVIFADEWGFKQVLENDNCPYSGEEIYWYEVNFESIMLDIIKEEGK